MAKKRKTLRDKQRAALRQQASRHQADATHVEQQIERHDPIQEERQKFSFRSTATTTRSLQTNETYTYLLHDLKKTALITGGIVLAQLALFYAMQQM